MLTSADEHNSHEYARRSCDARILIIDFPRPINRLRKKPILTSLVTQLIRRKHYKWASHASCLLRLKHRKQVGLFSTHVSWKASIKIKALKLTTNVYASYEHSKWCYKFSSHQLPAILTATSGIKLFIATTTSHNTKREKHKITRRKRMTCGKLNFHDHTTVVWQSKRYCGETITAVTDWHPTSKMLRQLSSVAC